MSEPTPTHPLTPALMKDAKGNTPWWRRPSNGALLVGFAVAVVGEFPRWVENVLPFVRDDWKPWLRIASYSCLGLAAICVRMGVTNAMKNTQALAENTAVELAKPPAAPEVTTR